MLSREYFTCFWVQILKEGKGVDLPGAQSPFWEIQQDMRHLAEYPEFIVRELASEMTDNIVILCKPDSLECLKMSRLCLLPTLFIPTLNFEPTNRKGLEYLRLPYIPGHPAHLT